MIIIHECGVKYPLKDWQGSTRGSISNTGNVQSRQDFTAFGEEIGAGTGLRTSRQGFGASDTLREKYGLTERDDATGLDHTWFRKHENQAGRWTSPDPYLGSMSLGSSQSFNRYSYVENQPTNFVDPSGLNASAGFCIQFVTWGHWTNDPDTTHINTRTFCFGGGGSGGGGYNNGGGGQTGGLRTAFNTRLNNGDCKKNLDKLLKDLGSKENITDLADKFLTNTGGKTLLFERPGREDAAASYMNHTIRIAPRLNPYEPATVSNQGNAGNFFHELIHAANGQNVGYSHESIVKAMYGNAAYPGIKKQILQDAKDKGLKGSAKEKYIDNAFSGKMNAWLGVNCPV